MKSFPIALARVAAFDALAPRRKVLLLGDGATGISSYIVARRSCQQLPVRFVCGDNRFNPYAITEFAKGKGVRPAEALNSIQIARAFTAFQLVELIQGLEAYANDFVIVTGICSAFSDEDLSHTDAARLFYRAFWTLHSLAESGVSVLLVEASPLPIARRRYFLKDLAQTSEIVLSITGKATFTLDQRFSRAQKRIHALNPRFRGE
jgi:hypothetical protein